MGTDGQPEVPASITLAHLHHVTQTVMGWEDYHLHEFETGTWRATSGRSISMEVRGATRSLAGRPTCRDDSSARRSRRGTSPSAGGFKTHPERWSAVVMRRRTSSSSCSRDIAPFWITFST
jgi:hypothetical protein